MNIIYVDDENASIERFVYYMNKLDMPHYYEVFEDPLESIEFVKENKVELAILDIEMPNMSGIILAEKLHEIDRNIRIIFITSFTQYALDAFGVDAIGYLVKPYSEEGLLKEIEKAVRMTDYREQRIVVQTMPTFEVWLDGNIVPLPHNKQRELLALMVDKRGRSMNVSEIISYLWEDKPDDDNSKSLVRVTFKRLRDTMAELGIDSMLDENLNLRAINPKAFECDYYKLLDGDKRATEQYNGSYMVEYSWAEDTNAELDSKLGRWDF
ncbi:MAG: response regulator [Pseudobutyrivibrio sp.]|nr:response regulator [Pseudobutyrivibrio sp.]